MDEDSIERLLERLGCDRIRTRGSRVQSSCPFPESHWRGDRNPSFSIKVDGGGKSPYFCFSCHARGTAEWLARETGNEDLVPHWQMPDFKKKNWLYSSRANKGSFSHIRRNKEPVFFDNDLVGGFLGKVSRKILDRGITLETAREWRLGIDYKNNRAIFTLYNVDGKLAVVMGRDLTGQSRAKYTNYVLDKKNNCFCPFIDHDREEDFQSPTKNQFLYGEYYALKVKNGQIERRSSDLIVVEGQMDVLSMWQRGWNVVGVLGSYPSKEQAAKLISLVPRDGRVISLMDGDEAGEKCAINLSNRINGRIPFFKAKLPDGYDPDSSTEETIKDAIEKVSVLMLTSKSD
jgi:DNA primase